MINDDSVPVWIEIDTSAFKKNIRVIRALIQDNTRIMGVVKFNAYGHGAVRTAQVLMENGIDVLGVACSEEGVELRKAGVEASILILNNSFSGNASEIVEYNLIPTIYSIDFADEINYYSQKAQKNTEIHIRLDTGSSIGVRYDELREFLQEIKKKKNLFVGGVFTHFMSTYLGEKQSMNTEFNLFKNLVEFFNEENIDIPIIHGYSSPGIFRFCKLEFSMIRLGTSLYGLRSFKEQNMEFLEPVMQLKTRILDICHKSRDSCMGYTERIQFNKEIRTALIPVGYGHMPHLMFMKDGEVLVRGARAPVIGKAFMGHMIIDITNVCDAEVGDEVVIFGKQNYKNISAEELAMKCGIDIERCESVCLLDRSIKRVYIE